MKTLILSPNPDSKNMIFDDFTPEAIKLGCRHLDYIALYKELGYKETQERILWYITMWDIDTVLLTSSNLYFLPEFYKAIHERAKLVIMLGDSEHYFFNIQQYLAQCADLVCTADFWTNSYLDNMGIPNRRYFGYFNRKNYQAKEQSLMWDYLTDIGKRDISFVGKVKGKIGREKYIMALAKAGFNVHVYENVSHQNKIDIFRNSKISLNFSGVDEETRQTRKNTINRLHKQVKGRLFEIAMSGGTVLTEYLHGWPNFHIDCFKNEDDLVDKAREMIDYKTRPFYFFEESGDVMARLPELLEDIKAIKNRPIDTVCVDPCFLEQFVSYHYYHFFSFLFRLELAKAFEELCLIVRYFRHTDILQAWAYFKDSVKERIKR